MKIKCLCIVFLMTSMFSFGQAKDYMFGQLVDSVQNEPIPFATIKIKNRSLGVISNIDGTFKIPLRYKALGEVVEISCLGYLSKEIPMADLFEGRSNIIILEPGNLELNEAIVSANIKKLSAQQIVKIAVNSIPQNFPKDAFSLVGYYRDYQVKNKAYTNLNEAIVKVLDVGFERNNNFNNQYQLISYTKNSDFQVDTFAEQPYDYKRYNKVIPGAKMNNDGGNELLTLSIHDAIRNYGVESFSFVDDLSSDFIEKHRFRLRGKSNYEKESIYEIDMVFKNDNYRARGKIFVNTDDFAIHKLDYAVYKRKKPGVFSSAENPNERFTDGFKKTNGEMLYHIQTEYTRGGNGKMFLNYISFYNKILVQRPAEFKSRFAINLEDNSFRIRLNKIPANLDRIKSGNFKISYKNVSVPIKDVWFREDERVFVVCPHTSYEATRELLKDLFLERKNLEVSEVKYAYSAIKDDAGNELDKRKWEYMHQYREFFTQETRFIQDEIGDTSDLMNKDQPLDSPLQPITDKDMKSEYWKNTPLPGLQN